MAPHLTGCNIWKNRSCPSGGRTLHLGSTVELTWFAGAKASWPWGCGNGRAGPAPLICHVVTWVKERCPLLFAPQHLQQVGDLTQPLICCSSQENRSCASPGQHSRADPVDRNVGEPALRAREGRSWCCVPGLQCGGGGEGKRPCPLPLLPPAVEGVVTFTSFNIQESRPCTLSGHLSGTDPVDEGTS